MSEKQTNTPEQPSTTEPDNFENILEIQNNQVLAAAKRVLEAESSPEEPEATAWDFQPDSRPDQNPSKKRRNRFLAGTSVLLAIGAGAAAANSPSNQPPTFSEETITFTAGEGDSVYDAAEQVKNINSADKRDVVAYITQKNFDKLRDDLQQGEQITIPVSVNEKK